MPRDLHQRLFFAHNGPGPYECFLCKQSVTIDKVTVHHDDDDHSNNDPANLRPAHHGCHTKHHASQPHRREQLREVGKRRTPESRRRAALAMNAAQSHESRSEAAKKAWATKRAKATA